MPAPDGSIDAADRQQLAFVYRGMAATVTFHGPLFPGPAQVWANGVGPSQAWANGRGPADCFAIGHGSGQVAPH